MYQTCQAPGQASRAQWRVLREPTATLGDYSQQREGQAKGGPTWGKAALNLFRCVDKEAWPGRGCVLWGSGPELADKEGTWLLGCICQAPPLVHWEALWNTVLLLSCDSATGIV